MRASKPQPEKKRTEAWGRARGSEVFHPHLPWTWSLWTHRDVSYGLHRNDLLIWFRGPILIAQNDLAEPYTKKVRRIFKQVVCDNGSRKASYKTSAHHALHISEMFSQTTQNYDVKILAWFDANTQAWYYPNLMTLCLHTGLRLPSNFSAIFTTPFPWVPVQGNAFHLASSWSNVTHMMLGLFKVLRFIVHKTFWAIHSSKNLNDPIGLQAMAWETTMPWYLAKGTHPPMYNRMSCNTCKMERPPQDSYRKKTSISN